MDTVIRFRVATEDRERFEKAAKLTGQSLSEWIREGLRASADCDLEPGALDDPPKVSPSTVKVESSEPTATTKRSQIDPKKIDAFQRLMARKK